MITVNSLMVTTMTNSAVANMETLYCVVFQSFHIWGTVFLRSELTVDDPELTRDCFSAVGQGSGAEKLLIFSPGIKLQPHCIRKKPSWCWGEGNTLGHLSPSHISCGCPTETSWYHQKISERGWSAWLKRYWPPSVHKGSVFPASLHVAFLVEAAWKTWLVESQYQ